MHTVRIDYGLHSELAIRITPGMLMALCFDIRTRFVSGGPRKAGKADIGFSRYRKRLATILVGCASLHWGDPDYRLL